MPSYLNPPQNGVKPSSRFSTLNVFKLKPGSANDAAPPPPPKDPVYASSPNPSINPPSSTFYNKSFFSRSAVSLVPSLSPESISGPATPASPYPPIPSAGFDFGKRPNGFFPGTNGRAAAGSPVPSASGGSLKSFGRGGGDYLPSPSMDGTDSSGSCPNPNVNLDMYLLNSAKSSSYAVGQTTSSMKPKKTVFKLASLAKKNRSKKDLSDAASVAGSISRSVSEQETDRLEGDEGVSLPWNFQHNIHVDEGYIGLPPSWSSALSQVGFNEDEIAAIHARRLAAATGMAPNTNLPNPHTNNLAELPPPPHVSAVSPPTTSTLSSSVLLAPVPRSTSLRKGRDALTIHPPSVYSVATSSGPPSIIGRTSPAPSPKAPSFSMKSFVSGLKNSLTSDSVSMKEGVGSSRRGEDAMSVESEQYVFVDGEQGMGDEPITELYPYDTASISSHHTHASSIRSQVGSFSGQQTPRIPTFPQIQVQRAHSDAGHVSLASSVSRAPSPLAHSISIPLPTPPRGYTYPDPSISLSPSHSSAGLRPGPSSAPPRTPPKRIYHVANPSSGSSDGVSYHEPPPAYVSPKKEVSAPRKEKEGFGVLGALPPPNRPIPPVPTGETMGESSGLSNFSREEDREASMPGTTGLSVDNIHEVFDISSHYSDNVINGGDAEMKAQQVRLSSPTPPLVIDKRLTKLAMLPPRISFHQEGSLEDWTEALFKEIGGKGKRSSVLMGSNSGDAASVKKERRTTIRPMSHLFATGGDASVTASDSLPPEAVVPPSLLDLSFGANLTPGPHAIGTIDAVEEGDEQEQAEEGAPEGDAGEHAVDVDPTTAEEEVKEADGSPVTPSTPVLPDVSVGLNVSSLGKDLDPPASLPPSPPESPRRTSVDSLPPSPPPKPKPKPKPKPAPLAILPPVTLAPPRTNVITGISGKSPVNPLFGAKPQPLPIPIPPSQIRAQLRPPPPKPFHPPPTLPLPPLKRLTSQPNLPPPSPARTPSPSVPSPQRGLKHDSTASQASPSDSRPDSSQTLLPVRVNGDRDSNTSTITVTPATIATAKTEVVRTAVASV
ncbi:hypothetical protein V8E55_009440, partial [Tylopilus felleus]